MEAEKQKIELKRTCRTLNFPFGSFVFQTSLSPEQEQNCGKTIEMGIRQLQHFMQRYVPNGYVEVSIIDECNSFKR